MHPDEASVAENKRNQEDDDGNGRDEVPVKRSLQKVYEEADG
jgi:hypothetical protein